MVRGDLWPLRIRPGRAAVYTEAAVITIDELLERFLSNPAIRLRVRKQSTIEHYHRSVRQFQAAIGRVVLADELSIDLLAEFAASTLDQGHCEATANQRCKQIHSLWEWAARERLVDKFPPRFKVDEPERLPTAWRPDELQTIFEASAELPGWIGPHDASTWATGLHRWLLDTGERAEATLCITPSMIDFDRQTARIPAQIRKGGRKAMVYKLTQPTCDVLRTLCRKPDEPIFTQPWKHRSSFYHWYRSFIEGAGLHYEKHKSGPHKMRITVLTMVEASGGNATDFARHSSRRVTEAYIDRELLLAHQKGVWPRDDFDPLTPKPDRSRRPWWLRLVS